MASSKHHRAWVESRRQKLSLEFSRAAFVRLSRAFAAKQLTPLPSTKRPPPLRAMLASLPGARCVGVPLFDIETPHPALIAEMDAGVTVWFFTPLGDPLLKGQLRDRTLVWEPFTPSVPKRLRPSSSGARRSPRAAST